VEVVRIFTKISRKTCLRKNFIRDIDYKLAPEVAGASLETEKTAFVTTKASLDQEKVKQNGDQNKQLC
jgi:hypothetical protein